MSEMAGQALADLADLDPELGLRLRAILILQWRIGRRASRSPGIASAKRLCLAASSTPGWTRRPPPRRSPGSRSERRRGPRSCCATLRPWPSLAVVLAFTWADRLDEAARVLDHAVDLARRLGSAIDYASAMTLRARVHQRAGRLGEAEADARAALEVPLDVGWRFARGSAPLIGSLLDQGRADEAGEVLVSAGLDGAIPDAPPMSPVLLARMRLRAISPRLPRRPRRLGGGHAPGAGHLARRGGCAVPTPAGSRT